jgi:hypothetical protein
MAQKKAIHTLHRYFIWADRMRVHVDLVLQGKAEAKINNDRFEVESWIYIHD